MTRPALGEILRIGPRSASVSYRMGSKLAAVAAVALLTAALALGAEIKDADSGSPDLRRRNVLDGELASASAYPYLAHLAVPWHGTCSGALIAMDWIVTAAHCVVGADIDDMSAAEVSVGWPNDPQYRRVWEVWTHPRYTAQDDVASTDWDVALVRLLRPVEAPAAPVRLGSAALSNLVGPEKSVVIVGDAGVRGRPLHATITLEDCPPEAGSSQYQVCHGRENRPVVSPGDSGGPMLVGDQDGGARLMGVASTGSTISGHGWARWTRIEHVSEWILAVLLLQGTEGRSDAPSCALPPSPGDTSPVGGRVFSLKRLLLCAPLGDSGEGVLFEYRTPPGASNPFIGEDWYLSGASTVAYQPHVKDSSGKVWRLNGFGGYAANPCPDGSLICNALTRVDQIKFGISLDLAKNPAIRCVPENGL